MAGRRWSDIVPGDIVLVDDSPHLVETLVRDCTAVLAQVRDLTTGQVLSTAHPATLVAAVAQPV